MFCRHSHHGEAARLGAVCQPRSCFASLIMQQADKHDSVQPSLSLAWGWAEQGRREIPRSHSCDHTAQFAFMPTTFMSCYLEGLPSHIGKGIGLGVILPLPLEAEAKPGKKRTGLQVRANCHPYLQAKARTRTRLFCTFRKHWPVNFSPQPTGQTCARVTLNTCSTRTTTGLS